MMASGAFKTPRRASSAPTGKYVSKSASRPLRFERHSPVSWSYGASSKCAAREPSCPWQGLAATVRPDAPDAAHAPKKAVLEVDQAAASKRVPPSSGGGDQRGRVGPVADVRAEQAERSAARVEQAIFAVHAGEDLVAGDPRPDEIFGPPGRASVLARRAR